MHTVDPNGKLDVTILDRYQDYYLRTGDQARKLDLDGFIDAAPLDAALTDLGQL